MKALSQNKIKQIRALFLKKQRDEQGLFLVEGEKMVQETLESAPELIQYCVALEGFTLPEQYDVETFYCDADTLKKCSSLNSPNKVIAVVKKIQFEKSSPEFIIALDAVQDPGNMGTIMRLADWYGVQKIICSINTVDVYNSKVIQASMGAFLRIPVEYVDLNSYLSSTELPVFGALLEGENVYKQQLKPSGILLMGNEGNGISDALIEKITHPISIPRFGKAESLNVSIATGILLSEFYRNS